MNHFKVIYTCYLTFGNVLSEKIKPLEQQTSAGVHFKGSRLWKENQISWYFNPSDRSIIVLGGSNRSEKVRRQKKWC